MTECEVNLPIKRVTIYPENARIVRSHSVSLKKGENKLIVKNLPANLTEDSIRIDIDPHAKIKIIDVYAENPFIEAYDKNLFRKTKQELDLLIYKRKKLEAHFKNLNQELLLFLEKENLEAYLDEQKHTRINLDNWQEFFLFLRNKLKTNRDAVRKNIISWLEIQQKIRAVQKNIDKFNSYDQVKEHRVNIIIEAAQNKEQEIDLAYLQPAASWHPAYTLRANLEEKTIQVFIYGMITQNSGEDWHNIEILLSTAQPLQNCNIPELLSKRIKESDTEIIISDMAADISEPAFEAEKEMKRSEIDELRNISPEEERSPEGDMSLEENRPPLQMDMLKSKAGRGFGFKHSKKIIMQEKEFRKDMAPPKVAPAPRMAKKEMHDDALESKQKLQREYYKRPAKPGGFDVLRELLNSLDTKILPAFSLELVSHHYKELFGYMEEEYTPENILPVERETKLKQFFQKGVSPLKSLGGYDYRYKVSTKENKIPSLGVPVQVGVDIKDFALDLVYVTVPVEKEAVFLKANFANDGSNPLPAGPAQVFVENNFLGNIMFPTLGLNQKSAVSLGIERDIKVLRRQTEQRKSSGVIKKDVISNYTVEIELISHKPYPVKIEVYDRIPISSQNKEIEVMDIRYDQKPNIISKRQVLMWQMKLFPRKKSVLKFSYSIKQPENYRLTMSRASHPYS